MIQFLFILFISFSASAGPWENLNQGDQTAQTLLNQMNSKKAEAGSHPFYTRIAKEANYQATDLVGKSQGVAAQDSASQMVRESSDVRPQVKIDPSNDPLLTGSQKVLVNPLEVIGGAGTQVIEVQQGGKTGILDCEEGGEDVLETCTRELVVKVIKTKVQREWHGAFQYSKCSAAEKSGHYLPCQLLRNSTSKPREIKHPRKGGPVVPVVPQDPDAWLNITQAYKACMAEIGARRHGRGCGGGCHTLLPVLGFRADQISHVFLIKNPQNPRMLLMNRSYHHTYKSGRTEYDIHPRIKIIYEEDFDELLDNKIDLFCVVPLDMIETMSGYLRLFTNIVLGTVIRQSGYKTSKERILLMLDEFPRLGAMRQLINIVTVAAGAGIEAFMVAQDKSSIEAVWGKETDVIFGSSATVRIFNLGRTDGSTAAWASSLMGDKTVITRTNAAREYGNFLKGAGSESVSQMKEKLLTATEIQELGDTKMLCFLRGQKPLLLERIISHKHPLYKHRLDPNPTLLGV